MKDNLLKRTNVSSLTDDDLLLMDEMIGRMLPFWSMRRKSFGMCFNTKTHGMDDVQLRGALSRLVEDGLLKEIPPEATWPIKHTHFGLTEAGGRLWEAERTPVWDRYLCLRGGVSERKHLRTVYALREDILADYIGLQRKFWLIPAGEMKVRSYCARNFKNHTFVPWLTFPMVYGRTVLISKPMKEMEMLESMGMPTFTWEQFELERTWWQSVREMQKFL